MDGKYTKLSGGWRSRCALAGGLLVGSELLLLDGELIILVFKISTDQTDSHLLESLQNLTTSLSV